MLFKLKRCIALSIIVPLSLVESISLARPDSSLELKTVVIDAGHGGHDPGTISPDGKIKESAINLDIALALGKKIEEKYPGVKVLYTRKTDKFIPLVTRADIANRNHADLFISIHVNSVKKESNVRGVETFVMGTDKSASNMEVCKRENSVILLEEDYTTTYQGFNPNNAESYIFFNLMQNASFEQSISMASFVQQQSKKGPITVSRGIKQAPILVLWKTTMPSVLVEVGFLSNQSDRKVLASKSNRDKIAGNIFRAFCAFKEQYDHDMTSGLTEDLPDEAQSVSEAKSETTPKTASEAAPKTEASSEKVWRIQIFASKSNFKEEDSRFKGLKNIDRVKVNGLVKYSVGRYSSEEEAEAELKAVKKKFPDAFIVYR